jgi:hypothetical protein
VDDRADAAVQQTVIERLSGSYHPVEAEIALHV